MTERQEFTRYFREVQPKFSRLCARSLSKGNLTLPQFALLSVLAEVDTLPMTEISSKLHITKPAVTSLVDRLEKNRYLRRVSQPGDRRVHLLQILPKGRTLVRQMQSTILGYLLKALEQFNATERKTITRFYERLSEIMEHYLVKDATS